MMNTYCIECSEPFNAEELKDGMCEDCRADFDALDLEDRFERAFKYGDKKWRGMYGES